MTTREVTASDLVSACVKELRKQLGWTAQQLAERCAQAGAPQLTAPVIANIETGRRGTDGRRRRDVTIDETLVLAYVLGVSPVRLLVPIHPSQRLAITSDVVEGPFRTLLWATGQVKPAHVDPQQWGQANSALSLYQAIHDEMADATRYQARGQGNRLQQRLRLLAHLLTLAGSSGLEIPALPPEWVTRMQDEGWLKDLGQVPVSGDADRSAIGAPEDGDDGER